MSQPSPSHALASLVTAPQPTFGGRYEVVRLLGRGGMGAVYQARDRRSGELVAIKVLSEELARRPDLQQRFRREARALALLRHPNVVRFREFDAEGPAPFIVMEYVEGRPLDGQLPLPPQRAVEILAQICDALAAAHRYGLVHRDLKPANVLVTPAGRVKVTDFGVAAFTHGERDDTRMTAAAHAVGTPGYIAPEALRGEGQGAPGDLFALGVILYFCATGTHPFTAPSTAQVLKATLAHTPRAPRLLQAGLHVELEAVILGLLGRSPAERQPGSAAALVRRLEELCAREGWRWETPPPAPARAPVESPASHSVLLENLTDRGWTTRGPARLPGPHEEAP